MPTELSRVSTHNATLPALVADSTSDEYLVRISAGIDDTSILKHGTDGTYAIRDIVNLVKHEEFTVPASSKNEWHHCTAPKVHVRHDKDFRLCVLADQHYDVSNSGVSTITVSFVVRGSDGVSRTSAPIRVHPGQRRQVN